MRYKPNAIENGLGFNNFAGRKKRCHNAHSSKKSGISAENFYLKLILKSKKNPGNSPACNKKCFVKISDWYLSCFCVIITYQNRIAQKACCQKNLSQLMKILFLEEKKQNVSDRAQDVQQTGYSNQVIHMSHRFIC